MKQCSKCGAIKEPSDFNKSNSSSDGRRPECRACRKVIDGEYYKKNVERLRKAAKKNREGREHELSLRRMGLTVEQYDAKLKEQGGVCAICNRPETLLSTNAAGDIRRLNIDHDHNCCDKRWGLCGKCNRGLLCSECNQGLGRFEDNIEYLASAIDYLERYNDENRRPR